MRRRGRRVNKKQGIARVLAWAISCSRSNIFDIFLKIDIFYFVS
jgi:hypothetical protein